MSHFSHEDVLLIAWPAESMVGIMRTAFIAWR